MNIYYVAENQDILQYCLIENIKIIAKFNN